MPRGRKKKQPALPSIHSLNITRYTEKSWLKSYPSSDSDEWRERTVPENIYDFISNTFIMLENSDFDFVEFDEDTITFKKKLINKEV